MHFYFFNFPHFNAATTNLLEKKKKKHTYQTRRRRQNNSFEVEKVHFPKVALSIVLEEVIKFENGYILKYEIKKSLN